ncbi:hypothetical protein [Roseiconus lacunae]|uniref:Uncharacterized protein n=1 Tax=Roseiconus lacunae TaxID=2605694 RepID=A0ABT7PQC9_9BACT|nr:hypothetical protein [Roseiconus lacunae]MCD0462986.1 hypothetical protein [Roseiconus lacunae]MDM4018484.1 hypothetical protein [Roseiconus lacunae]WRQ49095.1 hypothetical protein U8335_19300 [Stieleria sp. HD01]
MTEFTEMKTYDIQQIGDAGSVLATIPIDAISGEAAAKQLKSVERGTEKIVVCLDGAPMNEMGVDYWQKRVRRR